ncbi:MAG TPA: ABC transporter transmembrane domain-containing protein, partial [Saprospiraceae bacterium]|nr:ABC transporter transmembrane domain-containing protein [Saprospiraceae bacterium]
MADNTAPTRKMPLLGRVLALAKPYAALFAATTLLALLLAPLSVLRPYLIKVMVDEYIAPDKVGQLTQIAIFLIVLLIVEAGLQYVFQYGTSWLGQGVVRDLRVRVFQHITNLRLSYFDRTPIGTSTTRT